MANERSTRIDTQSNAIRKAFAELQDLKAEHSKAQSEFDAKLAKAASLSLNDWDQMLPQRSRLP